jgi:hypothetical protein
MVGFGTGKGEGFHRRKMMEDNGDKEPEVRAVI